MDKPFSSRLDPSHPLGAILAIGILMTYIFVMVVGDGAAVLLINKILDSGLIDASKNSEHTASALLLLRQLAGLIAASAFLLFCLGVPFMEGSKGKALAQIRLGKNRSVMAYPGRIIRIFTLIFCISHYCTLVSSGE
jgi:hypothetical protein